MAFNPYANLNPEFARRLQALIAAAPGQITLRGGGAGYRTYAQQVALYKQKPHLAAKPGRSRHGKGEAYDLVYAGGMWGPVARWAHANAARFGLDFPMLPGKSKKIEPWHIELAGGAPAGGYAGPPPPGGRGGAPGGGPAPPDPIEATYGTVTRMLEEGPGNLAQQIQVEGVAPDPLDRTMATVSQLLGAPIGEQPTPDQSAPAAPAAPPAPAGGGGGGDMETWIREAMRITGVGEDWYPFLRKRMMQESGGRNIPQKIIDVNTRKGTPAFGPMQVIEPTFRRHALPGYGDWRNPLHNTVAAIQYIKGRYKHPSRLPRGGY